MTEQNRAGGPSRPLRTILKALVLLLIIAAALVAGGMLLLPSIISSDFGRNQVVSRTAEALQRPVSLERLSFSWGEGLSLANFSVKNADETPLVDLSDLQLRLHWTALASGTVVVESLIIDGLAVTVTRDERGRTSIDDLMAPSPGEPVAEKAEEGKPSAKVPAIFLDAHLKNSHLTFIDQRLNSMTEIRNLAADITVHSLREPIDFRLRGDIVLDNKSPEPIQAGGNALLAPEGDIDPLKAKGAVSLKASFGDLEGEFDLARFASDQDVTGATVSCRVDLAKAARIAAGIVGLPPDFLLKGELDSSLQARGNLNNKVTVTGETQLKNLFVSGGPFKDAPFIEPHIDFDQVIAVDPGKNMLEIQSVTLTSKALDLRLRGTVRELLQNQDVAIQLDGTGNLHELTRIGRSAGAVPADVSIKGSSTFNVSCKGTQEALQVSGKTTFQDVILSAPFLGGVPLEEKLLGVNVDLVLNVPGTLITVKTLSIAGSSLTAGGTGSVDGEGNVDVEVTASALFPHVKKQLAGLLPPSFPEGGSLSSRMTIKGTADRSISATGDHTVADVTVVLPASTPETPPARIVPSDVTIHHEVEYNASQDSLVVKKVNAKGDFFSLDGSVSLTRLSEDPRVTCQTSVTLAMAEALLVLGDLVPRELSAQGDAQVEFSGEGMMTSPSAASPLSTWSGKGSFQAGSLAYEGLGTIENLRTTQLALNAGKADLAIECLVNKGLSTISGSGDFSKTTPALSMAGEGKGIQVSQNTRLLGYLLPVFIAPSGQVSGTGNFSVQASWEGLDWEKEISRTIAGDGTVRVTDGVIRGQGLVLQLLRQFGKAESFEFKEIMTGFRLAEEKIYNDKIQVDGADLDFQLQGWTSLVFVPEENGNPMEYTVAGDFVQDLGKDAQKILSALGGEKKAIPIGLGGTVQNPRISVKMPKAQDLLQQLLQPSERKRGEERRQPRQEPPEEGNVSSGQ